MFKLQAGEEHKQSCLIKATLASLLEIASSSDYSPTSWSNGLVAKRGIAGVLTTTDFAFPVIFFPSFVLFHTVNTHSNANFMNVRCSCFYSTQSLLRQTATS